MPSFKPAMSPGEAQLAKSFRDAKAAVRKMQHEVAIRELENVLSSFDYESPSKIRAGIPDRIEWLKGQMLRGTP